MRTHDRGLLQRYREQGDHEAFRDLFVRTGPQVRRLARRLRIPESEVDDLVQDVFVTVAVRAGHFDDARCFRSWVNGIAWKKILMARRGLAQRRVLAVCDRSDEAACPSESAELDETQRTVREAVARLPRHYRTVIELYFLESIRAVEIARRLRKDPSTVRTQIARGVDRLRELIPPSHRDLAQSA